MSRFLCLAIALCCSAAMASAHDPRFHCVEAVITERDAQFAAFQDEITQLTAEVAPDLEPVAARAGAAQVAMRRAATRELFHLLLIRPDVLWPGMTLSQLVNSRLTEVERAALRRGDPGFGVLEAARDSAVSASEGDPGLSELRDLLIAESRNPNGLAPILIAFGETNERLNTAFAGCFVP